MKINFALLSSMLLTFVVNYSCASVVICFVKNGVKVYRSFDSEIVTYAAARVNLQLTEDDIFMDSNRAIERRQEQRMIVSDKECNGIISQSAKSYIEVCIVNDQCKTFYLENNAKLKTLRDMLLASLPEYYRDEKCAYIVFLNDKGQVIRSEDEIEVPYRDIMKNGRIEAHNKFIENTTKLDITWLLYSHRVHVNILMSLSSLRYWITKPNACPNLKSKLNLPDKALFPNAIDDLAQNWLTRDKRAQLQLVTSRTWSTQLVAPYAHEESLSIKSYAYKTEKSDILRLYYVNVNEKDKVAFTGSRTDEFQDNQLTFKISSRSPKDKILLPLKDVRSTNNRAISWTNAIIATNNTAVTLKVTWNNHQPGYAYICELFDFRANHEKHYLFRKVTEDGVCELKYIDDNNTFYDLLFNKEELIENGQDLAKFRYELGVSMYPSRPGKWSCRERRRRETQSFANTDIHQDQITMGGGGKGYDTGLYFKRSCVMRDNAYSKENQRSLYFNVFIFKSQEIAEKIIEDVATF